MTLPKLVTGQVSRCGGAEGSRGEIEPRLTPGCAAGTDIPMLKSSLRMLAVLALAAMAVGQSFDVVSIKPQKWTGQGLMGAGVSSVGPRS